MKPLHVKEMPRKKRVVILILALVLLLGCAVSGTYAWLYFRSGPKVISLYGSDLQITLTETTGSSYQMIPGETIPKNPMVTVKANSVKSWVFVRVENINATTYMNYTVNTSLTKLSSSGNYTYYYCLVEASASDQPIYLINPQSVYIPESVITKEMLKAVVDNGTTVQLNFSACAVQYEALTDVNTAFAQAVFK